MNKLKKSVYADCAKAMWLSTLFSILDEVGRSFLTVYAATVLGSFADAVFSAKYNYVMSNSIKLLVCVLIMVIVMPFINMLCNMSMLKNALVHDRILLGRFLDKEWGSLKKINQGEVQYRLEKDSIELRYYFMEVITKIVVIPFMTVYLLRNAFKISIELTVITFCISMAKILIQMLVRKTEAKYDKKERDYKTEIRSYEAEITTRPYIVRLYGLKKGFCDDLDALYNKYFHNTEAKKIVYSAIIENVNIIVDTVFPVVILLVGAAMVAVGKLSSGGIVAMLGYLHAFDNDLYNIRFIIRNTKILKNVSERLSMFYVDVENLKGQDVKSEISIAANNLSFAYDTERKVICELNFILSKGMKVAICGANGSGKSTLMKIISGLEKKYSGSIKVNGVELKDASIVEWRKQFALALQDPYLFEGTVEENIRLGNLCASEEDIDNVMQEVGILHLKGRKISASSNDLSGGEKQRISVGRALIKGTQLLVLDEPNNNLDAAGLEWLIQFIRNSNMSILYISHDEALTACAGKVISL